VRARGLLHDPRHDGGRCDGDRRVALRRRLLLLRLDQDEDDLAELGLGLRPDLTGRGLGAELLAIGLHFAEDLGAERCTLAVAAFNRRAITV